KHVYFICQAGQELSIENFLPNLQPPTRLTAHGLPAGRRDFSVAIPGTWNPVLEHVDEINMELFTTAGDFPLLQTHYWSVPHGSLFGPIDLSNLIGQNFPTVQHVTIDLPRDRFCAPEF